MGRPSDGCWGWIRDNVNKKKKGGRRFTHLVGGETETAD